MKCYKFLYLANSNIYSILLEFTERSRNIELISSATITTGCKVNIYLHIGSKRPDGYHELESLFLPLSIPCDTIHIKRFTGSPCIEVDISDKGIDPLENTFTKAYDAFIQKIPLRSHFSIFLEKKVPHGAGLGGGSANAAGFLLFLQKVAQEEGFCPLEASVLADVAVSVGADVPFFLLNKPAIAKGIGEQLQLVDNPYAGWTLLLICPDRKIGTPWAFSALDKERELVEKNREKNLTNFLDQDKQNLSHKHTQRNDFEPIVYKKFPELKMIKKHLLRKGATIAGLSGSGSSIFGLFKVKQDAQSACLDMKIRQYIVLL